MCKNLEIKENYILKIALCDDELESIRIVAKLLEDEFIRQDFNAEITLITDNQDEILKAITNKEIDILFLDVDFKNGGKNGIESVIECDKIVLDDIVVLSAGKEIPVDAEIIAINSAVVSGNTKYYLKVKLPPESDLYLGDVIICTD